MLLKYDINAYEKIFGELEEAWEKESIMTIPMICDTFSVDQKNEMYKIISIILTCRKEYINVNLDFLSNDRQKEAAKLINNEAIKDMSGVKVGVQYE